MPDCHWTEARKDERESDYLREKTAVFPHYVDSPDDLFSLMVTDEILELIVRETNRNAREELGIEDDGVDDAAWTDTDPEKIRRYLGVVITMGLSRQPTIRHYWSKSEIYGVPLIRAAMPRKRFEELTRYLIFCNNGRMDPKDRLFKIRQLVNIFNRNFSSALIPAKDIVVDESMVGFRGRVSFRQYMKGKASKYGIQVFKVCTSSSYTLRTLVYTGKGSIPKSKNGVGYVVVMNLVGQYLNCGRRIYLDNYFTSIPLAEELLQNKTYMVGTIRANRKRLPSEFMAQKLDLAEAKGVQCQHGVKIVRWKGSKIVNMITTDPHHSGAIMDIGRKRFNGESVLKPDVIFDYNQGKKGVDVADQLNSYYSSLRKTVKWNRKVAFDYLVGMSVVNAQHLAKHLTGPIKTITLLKFRETLARQLINKDCIPEIMPLRRTHTLKQKSGLVRNCGKRCRRCHQILTKKHGSRTADAKCSKVRTFCDNCPEKPAMCLECFNIIHKIN